MKINKFEDTEAWQVARELTREIYKATGQKEFNRDYGLREQLQRASVSIMANIAEGFDSQSKRSFIQFLGYALRSSNEVQSHLYVALDQGYINQMIFEDLYRQAERTKSIIYGFIRYLRQQYST
ncbi:MAG: four helix bundle protein [Firmicutes bacterium]|nr:four helix bundle protein [Bacillota bacterium]